MQSIEYSESNKTEHQTDTFSQVTQLAFLNSSNPIKMNESNTKPRRSCYENERSQSNMYHTSPICVAIVMILAISIQFAHAKSTTSSNSIAINETISSTPNHKNVTEPVIKPNYSTRTIPSLSTSENKTIVNFGDEPSASIFKPSFFKGLLGERRKPGPGPVEEEEEEVTKTIVMPIKESEMQMGKVMQQAADKSSMFGGAAANVGPQQGLGLHNMLHMANRQNDIMAQSMKPEASLQLTSTEMSSLLNDREAPEFYRERELNGDGVVVGEENNKLWTAASSSDRFGSSGGFGPEAGFGSHGGFNPASSSGFDGDFINHRLTQAGSGDSGFQHRFGSQGFGSADELGGGYPGLAHGRLMQSPNEFSAYSTNAGGDLAGVGAFGAAGANLDYSPQSGLLRAGSGEFGGSEGAYGMGSTSYGASGGFGAGGYSNSPILDRHASELYGGSGGLGAEGGYGGGLGSGQFHGGSPGGDLSSIYNGRLASAGSHIPGQFGGSSDEFSSRFGQHSSPAGLMGNFDQRGFATQNNFMVRGNSMLSGSASSLENQPRQHGSSKLMPLSPIVPMSEELGDGGQSQGSYRESSNNVLDKDSRGGELHNNFRQQQQQHREQPQVHEALDDDASEPGDDGDESPSSSSANDSGDDENPMRASNMRSLRGGSEQSAANLVLNVPPPNIDNSIHSSSLSRPTIDFTRVGSAGYLGPSRSSNGGDFDNEQDPDSKLTRRRSMLRQQGIGNKFSKKNGFLILSPSSNLQEPDNQLRGGSRDNYDPSENPAHVGKYIID